MSSDFDKRTESERSAFQQGRYTGLTEAMDLMRVHQGHGDIMDKIRKLRPDLLEKYRN